jgi:hypothetical protein
MLPFIPTAEGKFGPIQPYVGVHAGSGHNAFHGRDQAALVRDPLPRTDAAKPGGLEQRPLDLASEVVVAGVADGPARQDMLGISQGHGKNMLYTPTFG